MVEQVSLDDIDAFAKTLVEAFRYRIILLKGDLGAGKTTLIQAIAKQLESTDKVSSPTFGIVNELQVHSGTAYHLDLYRIEKQVELEELGFEEYLNNGVYCFIEWPEIGIRYIPKEHHVIAIQTINENTRKITFV